MALRKGNKRGRITDSMREYDGKPLSKEEARMFVGIFSESVCKWLRAKREDLACSFKEIGVIIGVNWATVRKWELGLVKRCQPHNVRALRCYFMGKTEFQPR